MTETIAPSKPVPAAPAAPSPAPAPTAAPPPAPTPAPSASEPDPFAELSKKFEQADTPPPVTKGKETPTKPDSGQPAPAPTATAQPEKVVTGPKQLREELERVKGELKTRQDSYAQLEAKIKDFEARGKDTEQLLGRLESLQKELEANRAQLRRAKKEVDPDFAEKWDTPFNEMAEDAAAVFNQLTVTTTDANGQEQQRQAVWDRDFAAIFAMDRGNAYRNAKAMFGEESGLVMSYYDNLHANRRGRARELKRIQEHAAEDEKKEAEKETQSRSNYLLLVQQINKDLSESIEDYRDAPDDKVLVEARQKGYELFDTRPATLKESAVKAAHVRQRFAAYDPMRLTILRLKRQLAEANEKLDGLKTKVPNPKSAGGAPSAAPEESWEDAARKAVEAA